MSDVGQAGVRCPHCSQIFAAPAYTSLHVRRGEEIRDEILARTFERTPCGHCGGSVAIERPMIYTDFERFHMMALLPRDAIHQHSALARHCGRVFEKNLDIAAAPIVKSWAPRFVRRVVFGMASLREKLICLEHGIDDRSLEALKVWLLRDLAPTWLDWRSQVVLDRIDDQDLVLTLQGPPTEDSGVQVARVESVPLSNLARAATSAQALPGLQGLVVDWRALFSPDEEPIEPFADVPAAQVYDLVDPT